MSTINTTVFGTCADPDYSKPLPGEITHWTPPSRPQTCSFPVGLFADNPKAVLGPCDKHLWVGPPVRVLQNPNDKPPVFF